MNIKELKRFCENPETELVVHSAQHENKWFLQNGINANIVYDTRMEARLFDERTPADLGSLSLKLNIDQHYKDINPLELQGKDLGVRSAQDARNTLDIHNVLYPQLSVEEKRVYHEVLVPATKSLAQIEIEGVCVDTDRIPKVWNRLTKDAEALKLWSDKCIRDYEKHMSTKLKGGRFNPNSNSQKVEVIYDYLGYEPIAFTPPPANAPKTDSETLEALLRLQHQQDRHKGKLEDCKACQSSTLSKINKISQWLGWRDRFLGQKYDEKKKGPSGIWRYLVPFKGNKSLLFTDLMVAEAATGRIISRNPNLQNTPNNFVREIFVPRYDFIVEFDYKAIEWRIWACLSGDEGLIASIEDPHTDTARIIFNDSKITKKDEDKRHIGKTFNFTIINGGGPDRLSLLTGAPIDTAVQWYRRFWKQHPKGRVFWEEWVEADETDNYGRPKTGIVYTPSGMKRHFDRPTQARNQLIQNPALVILLKAANEVVSYVKDSGKGIIDLSIHDSLRMDAKKEGVKKNFLKEIKEIMEAQTLTWENSEGETQTFELPFLVECKVGKDWANCKEVEV